MRAFELHGTRVRGTAAAPLNTERKQSKRQVEGDALKSTHECSSACLHLWPLNSWLCPTAVSLMSSKQGSTQEFKSQKKTREKGSTNRMTTTNTQGENRGRKGLVLGPILADVWSEVVGRALILISRHVKHLTSSSEVKGIVQHFGKNTYSLSGQEMRGSILPSCLSSQYKAIAGSLLA